MSGKTQADPPCATRAAARALRMSRIAGRSFTTGLRAILFAIADLGWFLGPYVLMVTTLAVLIVIAHRQFFSDAHDAVSAGD